MPHTGSRPQGIEAWIGLQFVPGIGNATIRKLVDEFGSAEEIWRLPQAIVKKIPWLREDSKNGLLKGPDLEKIHAATEIINRIGGWIAHYKDEDFPPLLSQTHSPPSILYGIGKKSILRKDRNIAIIGSRKASSYGLSVARNISSGLAKNKVVITSGLALGIDTSAHRAAVDAGGETIGVLGCGIDIDYPRRNYRLKNEIAQKGAVITEFPPGTKPEPQNFPIRNRIISGLAKGIVIVEAGKKSGSLITASCGLDQGREVMAVPGSIYSFNSQGTHWLLKQGATLVENADDVLEALNLVQHPEDTLASIDSDRVPPKGMTEEEKRIYRILDSYPKHVDDISTDSDLPIAHVSGLLLQMELKDLVQALPGNMYQIKRE